MVGRALPPKDSPELRERLKLHPKEETTGWKLGALCAHAKTHCANMCDFNQNQRLGCETADVGLVILVVLVWHRAI